MKTEKELLSSVLKTAQMGQVGIRSVAPMATKVALQKALKDQLNEYNSIEKDVLSIAKQRSWELKDLDPISKGMSKMYARVNLSYGNVDSKIAAMMIQGNVRGIIKGIKNMHHCSDCDGQILAVARKLLDFEDANVKQMQGHL